VLVLYQRSHAEVTSVDSGLANAQALPDLPEGIPSTVQYMRDAVKQPWHLDALADHETCSAAFRVALDKLDAASLVIAEDLR
jgi:hypothetical protein